MHIYTFMYKQLYKSSQNMFMPSYANHNLHSCLTRVHIETGHEGRWFGGKEMFIKMLLINIHTVFIFIPAWNLQVSLHLCSSKLLIRRISHFFLMFWFRYKFMRVVCLVFFFLFIQFLWILILHNLGFFLFLLFACCCFFHFFFLIILPSVSLYAGKLMQLVQVCKYISD